MMASIASQGPRQLGAEVAGLCLGLLLAPDTRELPAAASHDFRDCGEHRPEPRRQGAPERSQLRRDVFHDNVLRHWENATRTNPQAPRRPAALQAPKVTKSRRGCC